MAKLVINTQYRENYAAQNEDYVHGVDETYWKFKGGSTYVVPNFKDVNNITEVMKTLTTLIEYGNPASEEYIIDYRIEDKNTAKVCESWETVTKIFIDDPKPGVANPHVTALKVTDNRPDEDGYGGYMRSEILELTEAWTMLPESERSDYSASYLMNDGDIVNHSELKEWFEIQEAA